MSFTSIWTDTTTTLEKVIWAVFIGVVIASVMLWYSKGFIGRVARRLLKKEIYTPEKSQTLRELGYDNFFIRMALKNKYSALRKVVYCTVDKEKLKRDDFYAAKFYIPEEQKDRAYFKYRGNNTTLGVVIIVIIIMFIMAKLCLKYIPELLELMKK